MIEIKTYSPKSHKIKCLIYGASGTGKTTFGGSAQDVIFASSENGLLSIAEKKVAFTKINTIEEFKELRDFLQKGEHPFKTLVIDSITDINNIIKDGIEKKTGKQMQLKDWGELSNKIKQILFDIKNIDMNVIIIAQEKYEKDDQVIQKIVPSLNGTLATDICSFMDIVGYIHIDKQGNRTLITSPSEKLLTKDRTKKIGNDTILDFEKWIQYVNDITIEEEEILYKIMTDEEKNIEEKIKIKRGNFENYKKLIQLSQTLDELKNNFLSIDKISVLPTHYLELGKIKDEHKKTL